MGLSLPAQEQREGLGGPLRSLPGLASADLLTWYKECLEEGGETLVGVCCTHSSLGKVPTMGFAWAVPSTWGPTSCPSLGEHLPSLRLKRNSSLFPDALRQDCRPVQGPRADLCAARPGTAGQTGRSVACTGLSSPRPSLRCPARRLVQEGLATTC